jgi:hypothetical protein
MLCSLGGKYRGEQGEAGHMGHSGTGEVPHSYAQLLQAIIPFYSTTDPHPNPVCFWPSGSASGWIL